MALAPPTATLVIGTISDQIAGVAFGVAGTYQLNQLVWQDNLEYQDDATTMPANPLVPIPSAPASVTLSSWSFQHPGIVLVGQHTIKVRDANTGVLVESNTFNVVGTPTITVDNPSTQGAQANTLFQVTGKLTGFAVPPNLKVSADGIAPVAVTNFNSVVTTTSFSFYLSFPAGVNTIYVTDGTYTSPTISFPIVAPPKRILPNGAANNAVIGSLYQFTGTLIGYDTTVVNGQAVTPPPPTLSYGWSTAPNIVMTQGVTNDGWSILIPVPTTISGGVGGLGGSSVGQQTLFVTDGVINASIPVTIVDSPHVIHPLAPANTVAGVAFTFSGVLQGYASIPALHYTIDGGAPVALLGVTTTGWAFQITAPAAGNHTITVTDGTITTAPVSFTVASVAAPIVTRDVHLNPGGDGTFWVDPIKTTARVIQSGALVTLLQNGTNSSTPVGVVNLTDFAIPWYPATQSDPLVKLTNGSATFFVHVPLGAVCESPYNTAGDSSMGGTDASLTGLVWSGSACKITTPGQASDVVQQSGSVITCGYGLQIDWGYGEIMMDAVTGQPGTNNSIGGINEFELQMALADSNYFPQHMISCAFDPAMVTRAGPLWPLKVIDTSLQNATANAFPQGVTICIAQNAVMPAGKSHGFQILWKIFQQFGGFYYNVAQNSAVSFGCKSLSSATSALAADIAASFSEIMGHMGYLDFGVSDANGNYNSGAVGAQYSLATQKGMAPGGVSAFPDPPPLNLSPTNLVNLQPSSVQAWYPSNYNNVYPNQIVGNTTTGGGGGGGNGGTGGNGSTVVPVFWNGNDKSSTVTLSNNNLTATTGGSNTPGTQPQGVRGTVPIDPTKTVLFEITFNTITQNVWAGAANANANFADGAGGGGDANSIVLYPATGNGSQSPQTIWTNSNQLATASGQPSNPGDVTTFVMRAGVLYASNAAMRGIATWNNDPNANPISNQGGIVFNLGSTYYPYFGDAEGGGQGTLNDGTQPLSAFATTFLAANPSVVTLSGQTPSPTTKTISVATPSGVVTNQSFQLSGTLGGYTSTPPLTYQIDSNQPVAIPASSVNTTSFTVAVSIGSSGSHSIVVSDGTITGTVSFNVGTTGTVTTKTRIVAPLTGNVTKGSWINIELPAAFIGQIKLASGKKPYAQILLPSGYDPVNFTYPTILRLHPDHEGDSHYTGGDSNNVVNDGPDSQYNNVAFRTAYPCIIIVMYSDQSTDPSSGVENDGGWTPNGQVGSASVYSGDTGPNVFSAIAWTLWAQSGTMPTTDIYGAAIPSAGVAMTGDQGRAYVDGFSLGGIGCEYLMLMYNQVNGLQKVFTAGLAFAGNLEINGYLVGPTSANLTAMTSAPLWAVSGANDSQSTTWNDLCWTGLAGNSNYPGYGTTAALSKAGTSQFHYWRVAGSGHTDQAPDGSYYHANTTLLNWLFAQITGAASLPATTNFTGITITNNTIAPNAGVGTIVGTLGAVVSAGAPGSVTFTLT